MTSSNLWPCVALANEPLAPRTSLRVGGRAEWLLEPKTPDELREANDAARERGLRVRVLGGGANLLVGDGVLPGVVIGTETIQRLYRPASRADVGFITTEGAAEDRELPDLTPRERHEDPRLIAWCGVRMPRLVSAAQKLGWSGLEGLVGVPGCVGGGVAMNAGGRWGDLWSAIESVRVLEANGDVRDLSRAECRPTYRNGGLGERVVLGAVFRFEVDERAAVRERMSQYLSEKRAVQPVTEKSAGCIFRNPDPELSRGRSAGQLVDECGGKSLSAGGAVVSSKHGNFIVNNGRASAADVFRLIEDVRRRVEDRAGIRLETEVRIWRDSFETEPVEAEPGRGGAAPG